LSVLNAATGAVEWTLRGRFRSVAPPLGSAEAVPWLVDEGEAGLRAMLPSGLAAGEPLALGGDLLPLVPAGPRAWVAARREGRVVLVSWDGARLATAWAVTLDGHITDAQADGAAAVLHLETGALVGLDLASGAETWRLPLETGDRYRLAADAGALLVLGARTLRVHDLATAATRTVQPLAVPAAGGEVRGTSMRWLDRYGRAYRAQRGGIATASGDIGLPLAAAAPVAGGFVVTTAAGEIGFVEWVDSEEAATAASASQMGGRR
jgi:hypothetical protein